MTSLPVLPPQEIQSSPALDANALIAQQLAEQALSAQFSMALSSFLLMQDSDDESDDDEEGLL